MADDCPKLRPELRFFYREGPADKSVLIEDPLGGAFLETDRDTAAFARLLTGSRTPRDAYRRLLEDRPGAVLAEPEIKPMLDELERHGLLQGRNAAPPTKVRRVGAISQRVRLGAGDRFFAIWASRLRWCYGPVGLIAWLVLLVIGLAELGSNWSVFHHELRSLFSVDQILLIWLAWVASKVWHEFQHGVVARIHGVEVREFGLLFILFVPFGAYVDVTGAWRLEGRWRRLHITAAGVIGELGLGAVAVLLWTQAPEGDWRAFLQALIVATMVSSLLFNANPLMRFDGYYALTDIFQIPNFYQRGVAATRHTTVRLLTGIGGNQEGWAIAIYGWLAQAWRLLLALTLTIVAAHLAFGFGLALALAVVWTMLLVPFGQLAAAVWKIGPAARLQAGLRLSMAAAALAATWYTPIPTWIAAPGIVEYRDSLELRAASSGQVIQIAVEDGGNIAPGDPVVALANAALEKEFARLSARLAYAEIELEQARRAGEPTVVEGRRELLDTAGQEVDEARKRLDELAVVAPRGGTIFGGELRDLSGAWVKRGDLIGEIADLGTLEIRAWMLPADAALLRARPASLSFHQLGFHADPVSVQLENIEPAAAVELPPAAITAEGGGPLALDIGGSKRRLAEARFLSTFLPDSAAGLYPGAPGRLTSSVVWRPLGKIIHGWFDRFDIRDPSRWALWKG